MINRFNLLIALLIHLPAFTQNDQDISIGSYDSLQSKILNEEQWLMVYEPPTQFEGQTFPVLYVLDGAWRFHSTVGMIHELGGSLIPPMIVIGITSNNRFRDFSPDGTEKFTSFIKEELFPYIDSKYPTAPYRMLTGHSLAGLFTANTLVRHTKLFNAYVLADPSLSFGNNQDLLNGYLETWQQQSYDNIKVHLAIANTLPDNMDTATVLKDSSLSTLHIRSILKFSDHLNAHNNGASIKTKYYENDNHASIPIIACHGALRSNFDYYPLSETVWEEGIDAKKIIEDHYLNISKELTYEVLPPEDLVSTIGQFIKSRGDMGRAEAVLQMNAENYPKSNDALEALVTLYNEWGKEEKAAKYQAQMILLLEAQQAAKEILRNKKE